MWLLQRLLSKRLPASTRLSEALSKVANHISLVNRITPHKLSSELLIGAASMSNFLIPTVILIWFFNTDEALATAKQSGVAPLIPSVGLSNWDKVSLASSHDEIYFSLGLHPYFIDQHLDTHLDL